jgi:BlaI family transcriptional regulator, penicillinase repressor
MGATHHLGELQYAIMRVLWADEEATVARVQEALATEGERDRALTTVATMLTKMEKKGIVSHRTEGRQFVYRAKISEAAVQRSMVAALTERLFAGDFSALVSHLLTEQEIDAGEVERLKLLIAERGARSGRAGADKERRRGK